jgi:hypothetical protein
MALLFFDGFDHYGTNGNPVTLGKWASGGAGTPTAQPTAVRTGSHALSFPNQNYEVISKALPASGGVVVGFALYQVAASTNSSDLLQVREGSTVHLALAATTGQLLVVKRGSTVLATGTTVLPLNSWTYIELKATIHDTTGSYEVRIDGVSEAALTASGVDTRNAGTTGQWDRIDVRGIVGGNQYIDDLYVCDQSGAAPRNTFLGSVKVETLYPQTDAVAAGSNAGLTPSTGTDHGALVDETTPNTSDYNSSPTVGLKDTYNYPSLTLTGTILGIQTNLYMAKSDAVARQVCAVVRAGGIDYDGANVSPLTTFSYFSEVRAQNPNTAADWTSSDIASLQAGMKVTA